MSSALGVVLDTNVLVSGLAYPQSVPGKIISAWRYGSVNLVSSEYILEEFRRVLPKLSHRHHLSVTEMNDLVDAFYIQVALVEPDTRVEPALRDRADQPVLATFRSAQQHGLADYLVTGDRDLLALSGSFSIRSPAEFWRQHGGL
jgi:putative PIN family toxin of toxin-antitoxin system